LASFFYFVSITDGLVALEIN